MGEEGGNSPLLMQEKQNGKGGHHADSNKNIRVHGFLLLSDGESPYNQAPMKIPIVPIKSLEPTYSVNTAVTIMAAPVVIKALDQYNISACQPLSINSHIRGWCLFQFRGEGMTFRVTNDKKVFSLHGKETIWSQHV